MPRKKETKESEPKPKKASTKTDTQSKKAKSASPNEYFFFADGRVAKSVKEMAMMLDDISEDVFKHHVNEYRNDFSNWVQGVFDEKELSELIKSETEIAKLQLKMLKHIANKYA